MLVWQAAIFLSIVAAYFFTPTASRVMSGLWILWTFTSVLGVFPAYVAVVNLFTTCLAFVILESLTVTISSSPSTRNELTKQSRKIIGATRRSVSPHLPFEEWRAQRDDLVRAIRKERQRLEARELGLIHTVLGFRRAPRYLDQIEAQLRHPKLEYSASRRLAHAGPFQHRPARPRKVILRRLSLAKILLKFLWLIDIMVFLCGVALIIRNVMMVISDIENYSSNFAHFSILVLQILGYFVLQGVLARITYEVREFHIPDGPRRVWVPVTISDH